MRGKQSQKGTSETANLGELHWKENGRSKLDCKSVSSNANSDLLFLLRNYHQDGGKKGITSEAIGSVIKVRFPL